MAKNMEIALLFDFYGDMLTDKQRDVVELYYDNDLSLSEIAENEGITRQGVRDSIKRAETQMLEMEDGCTWPAASGNCGRESRPSAGPPGRFRSSTTVSATPGKSRSGPGRSPICRNNWRRLKSRTASHTLK